jgi:CDP-glucose 4,6-dehydratase
MSTILVTGASGTIGAYLAAELLDLGNEIVSIRHDEKPFSTATALGIEQRITWCRGDILDGNLVKRVVADYAVSSIYHLAALPLVQVGTRTTVPVWETNIMGTINVLEAVKENFWAGKSIKTMIMATDKVYGDAGDKPYTEGMPLNGLSVYDASKACADLAARCYASQFKLPVSISRPCNVLAPADFNLGRVIPRTIVPAMRSEDPVLYRTNYLREFVWIEDLVRGLICVQQSGLAGHAYNLGSGHQASIEHAVSSVLEHFPGRHVKWIDPPSLSRIEIPYQKLNSAKARDELCWEAKVDFPSAVAKTVQWWRGNWVILPSSVRSYRVEGWHS